MEWHVWGPTDTEPTIYHDPLVLQYALSQFKPNDIVLVKTYKRLDMGAMVYNGPDKIPVPPSPTNPPKFVVIPINHVRRVQG